MENATKALLIAGGVLIVILIIGVGMAIFNAGQDAVKAGEDQAGSQALTIFNGQFEKYAGKQKGSVVRNLISTIITNNASSETKVNLKHSATTLSSTSTITASTGTLIPEANYSVFRNRVRTNSTYYVALHYVGGRITNIIVSGAVD